jgi:carbamate kinase
MQEEVTLSKLVVALGGNALQRGDSAPTAEAQLEVVRQTCQYIAELSVRGYELAIVHGNGPQVGRILLASETARDTVPPMPFDVCGAMSQGYIGYHIQQALRYALARRNRDIPVVTLLTQMVVEPEDPAFGKPTKPIGPFYSKEEAEALRAAKGYTMTEDADEAIAGLYPPPCPGGSWRSVRSGSSGRTPLLSPAVAAVSLWWKSPTAR